MTRASVGTPQRIVFFLLLVAGWLATTRIARAENTLRVGNAAAFAIVNNPPAPIQYGSRNFIVPLLESYAEYDLFEPRVTVRGYPVIDGKAFVERVRSALMRRAVVDIFILAHSNDYYRLLDWIEPALRQRIRLVYNSGCGDQTDAAQWLSRGAKAYIGHPDFSRSPVFLNRFRTYWWGGRSLKSAVALANSHLYATFVNHHGYDALEGIYSLLERRRGEEAYKATRATLFGDGDLTITSNAETPAHTFVLESDEYVE